ncbi:MAG: hypothetical protein M3Y48_17420 [Actinomycetota bacterium]|nr:hypothetical protein [Actinomycetota bacterium]
MTMSQETMTDAARRGQEAFTTALQVWTDSFQMFMPVSDTKLRGAFEAVDSMFDFAEQMLGTQREFTKNLLTATTSAATKAASLTREAAMEAKDVAKDVEDGANGQQRPMARRTASAHDVDAPSKK